MKRIYRAGLEPAPTRCLEERRGGFQTHPFKRLKGDYMKIHIKTIPADRFTPLVVFKKLEAKVLLESSLLQMGKSRYSIILVDEAYRLVLDSKGISKIEGKVKTLISKNRKDFIDVLKKETSLIKATKEYHIPIPACGLGYMGYESVATFEKVKLARQKDDLKIPDSVFLFGKTFVVFDHYTDEMHIVCIGYDSDKECKKNIDNILARLMDEDFRVYKTDETKYKCNANINAHEKEFKDGVAQIKEEIIKGNLVQGVLSRRIDVKTDLPPIEAYSRLRRENPSPYLFYLDLGDFTLLGASPELMVGVDDTTAIIKPIAGTRPRGKSKQEDLDLEKDLLSDTKERAEHLMLVDLARNDLGRIAKAGTVSPRGTFFIERFSHVMHIVSEIEATMEKGKDACDLIKATFPAGTVSGAPKIKAMEIISSLEKTKRGPYAGLIGHFDINGNFDSCITIRSFLYKKGNYYVQSGAGIVYDSVPEKEFDETIHKAKASIKALGVDIK